MPTDVDLVILGGGCAGLSLALRLAEQNDRGKRVHVIEARPAYRHDRSWCFWRLGPHRYEHLVKRSWSHVTLRSVGQAVHVGCAHTPYQLLESGVFYQHACQAIAANPSVQLHLGVRVLQAPQPSRGGWRIETSAGTLGASHVIDTRPPNAPRLGGAVMWQSFLGEELICDGPAFNPETVELMDFAHDSPDAVAFTYVLPLSSHRALVETTLFDPQPHSAAELAHRQQRAVLRLCGSRSSHALRTESGVLPMGMRGQQTSLGPGHWRAGLMTGAARPATGYAFQRIQRWADHCSALIRDGLDPIGHAPDPVLTRLMDRLFLDVLCNHPQRGPELFTRLFSRAATPRIVRFLSDRATLIDRVAVAASLPTGLFLKQLLRAAPRTAMRALTT